MYKIILIDDERIVLTRLKTFIPWEEYGFTVAAVFSAGREALDYMAANPVDAVITDIKMNGFSGIDFARYCTERHPEALVAFMSAYRDFEYARSAIEYNIVGYLVKPVIRADLTSLLTRLRERLDQPAESFKSQKRFTDLRLQYACQQVFSDLFCGATKSADDLKAQLVRIHVDIDPETTPCILINIHIQDFEKYMQNIWKYDEFRLYNAVNQLIPFETDQLYTFSVLYALGNIELAAIPKTGEGVNSINEKNAFFTHLGALLRDTLRLESEITVIRQYPSLCDLIRPQQTAPATESVLENDTLGAVLQYIHTHYAQIASLEDAANYAHLSPVYFGRFFKQHMRESFNAYLNRIRIEKAKALLAEKGVKASMVGEYVGFKNARYFYKIFKDITGLTPSQYQEQAEQL